MEASSIPYLEAFLNKSALNEDVQTERVHDLPAARSHERCWDQEAEFTSLRSFLVSLLGTTLQEALIGRLALSHSWVWERHQGGRLPHQRGSVLWIWNPAPSSPSVDSYSFLYIRVACEAEGPLK